jgi:hypothetical protein
VESTFFAIPSLDELSKLVHHALCDFDRLDPNCTPMVKSVVRRGGKPCGMFYQIQGPRQMRSYAIWAGEEGRVLFYNSAGERIHHIRLTESPDPASITP